MFSTRHPIMPGKLEVDVRLATPQRQRLKHVVLLVSVAIVLFLSACASGSEPSSNSAASLWASRPDVNGRYYAGNPEAKLLVEEFSDFQ